MQTRPCVVLSGSIAGALLALSTLVMRLRTHFSAAQKLHDDHVKYVIDHCSKGQISMTDWSALAYCKERDEMSRISPSSVALDNTLSDFYMAVLNTFFGGSMAFFLFVVWLLMFTLFGLALCLCHNYMSGRTTEIIPTHKKHY